MSDGMPMVNYANHVLSTTYANAKEKSHNSDVDCHEVSDIFEHALGKVDGALVEQLEKDGT